MKKYICKTSKQTDIERINDLLSEVSVHCTIQIYNLPKKSATAYSKALVLKLFISKSQK